MAKSKRPQRSVHAGGVPTAQIQTGVNPVDTFVNPGLVGMPQQTEGTVAPNQPDMQKARDLAALGQAFQGLSSSLGQLGVSEAKLNNQIEEWGFEQGLLKGSQDKTGLEFATAIDEGRLKYVDHPRFQSGYSKASASLHAGDKADAFMNKYEELRQQNPAFDTSEGGLKFFRDYMLAPDENMSKGSRSDVYDRTYQQAVGSHVRKFENIHAKYASKLGFNKAQQAFTNSVKSELLSAFTSDPVPGVTMGNFKDSPFLSVTNIEDLTPEQIEEQRINMAADRITALMDEEIGGVFKPDLVRKLIGESIINFGLDGRTAPGESEFAAKVLPRLPMGPKDGRGRLIEDPNVEAMWLEKRTLLEASNTAKTNAQINREHSANVEDWQLSQEGKGFDLMVGGNEHISYNPSVRGTAGLLEHQFYGIYTDMFKKGRVIEEEGFSLTFDASDNSITFENEIGGKKTVKLETMWKNIRHRLYNHYHEINEQGGTVEPLVAHVATVSQTGIPSTELTSSFTHAGRLFTETHRTPLDPSNAADVGEIEANKNLFVQTYRAYDAATKTNNMGLIEEMIPNKHTRDMFSAMHTIINSQFLTVSSGLGAADDEGLRGEYYDMFVSKMSQYTPEMISGFEAVWKNEDGDGQVTAALGLTNWMDIGRMLPEVKREARMHAFLFEGDVEDAIQAVLKQKTDRAIDVNGVKMMPEDMLDVIMSDQIPLPNKDIPQVIEGPMFSSGMTFNPLIMGGVETVELDLDNDGVPETHQVPATGAGKTGLGTPNIFSRDFWATVAATGYHTFDIADAAFSSVKENLTALPRAVAMKDPSILAEMFHTNDMAKVYLSINKQFNKQAKHSSRNITRSEMADAAFDTLKNDPPSWFSGEKMEAGGLDMIQFVPTNKECTFWALSVRLPDGGINYIGNPKTGTDFSLADMLDLGQWDRRVKESMKLKQSTASKTLLDIGTMLLPKGIN